MTAVFYFYVLTDEKSRLGGMVETRRMSAGRMGLVGRGRRASAHDRPSHRKVPEFRSTCASSLSQRFAARENCYSDYGDDFRKSSTRLFQIAHGEPPQPLATPPVEFFSMRNIYSRAFAANAAILVTCGRGALLRAETSAAPAGLAPVER
jgi:hypothetical protein